MTAADPRLFECVVNISEGRDQAVVGRISAAAGRTLLDVHSDPFHHRSVLTLGGMEAEVRAAVRAVASETVTTIDLRSHAGVHPRLGSLDVVPFVSLSGWPVNDGALELAIDARDDFASWACEQLQLPCFVYGPERTLPDVRRQAFQSLQPRCGPSGPHATAGACAVGARPLLVAYNLWLAEADIAAARQIAMQIRATGTRALGLRLGEAVQVSCNLITPFRVGPGAVFDAVSSQAAVARAELVGLVPQVVLDAEPRHRWAELGLDASTTIEARLEQAGLDGGRLN